MDKHDIKFKFKWTDGKEWIVKDFTLDEIMNGEPFDYLSDSPFFRNYKMVDRVQYTGLKDANGVEIYEGDILKWEDKEVSEEVILKTVKWEQESCSYAAGGRLCQFQLDDGSLTVIGNIHENPELLK